MKFGLSLKTVDIKMVSLQYCGQFCVVQKSTWLLTCTLIHLLATLWNT